VARAEANQRFDIRVQPRLRDVGGRPLPSGGRHCNQRGGDEQMTHAAVLARNLRDGKRQ
jgi:hypothetical protein